MAAFISVMFLACASLMPLPSLLLLGKQLQILPMAVYIASLLALLTALFFRRSRFAFHFVRLTLFAWVIKGIISFIDQCHHEPTDLEPHPGLNLFMSLLGIGLLGSLFYAFCFGRSNRAYFGMDTDSTGKKS